MAATGTSSATPGRCGSTDCLWANPSRRNTPRCMTSRNCSITLLSSLSSRKNTPGIPSPGCLYHGWDESRVQRWANKETGCSQHFWGRAIGWYCMGLVDVLDFFPNGSSTTPGTGQYPQSHPRSRAGSPRSRKPIPGGRCWICRSAKATTASRPLQCYVHLCDDQRSQSRATWMSATARSPTKVLRGYPVGVHPDRRERRGAPDELLRRSRPGRKPLPRRLLSNTTSASRSGTMIRRVLGPFILASLEFEREEKMQ